MRIYLAFLILLYSPIFWGQNETVFADVGPKMDEIPAQSTTSTTAIAGYISQHFSTPEAQLRAAFYWTASNLHYDVANRLNQPPNQTSKDKIAYALTYRKGVCMHYAEVFASISNQLGITTVLVEGYTKSNGKVDPVGHQWCVAKVNNQWSLYDPTWGAGYVNEDKYYPKLNPFYYNTPPQTLLLSHIPFDFLWQLSENPINNQDFYDGKIESDSFSPGFNFNQEIATHLGLSEKQKREAFLARMKKSGTKNALITERMLLLEKDIEAYVQNEKGAFFMSVGKEVQHISTEYNAFVKFRNRQFTPAISDDELKSKTQNLLNRISECQVNLNSLTNVSKENIGNVNGLKKAIAELKGLIEEQHNFVTTYLAKTPEERKKMFVRTIVKRR